MKMPETNNSQEALKELLYKIADDQLIYGHRNSEWTGIGPTLEEDISFSSIAQDKIGHAYNFYQLLESLGEGNPDDLGFKRKETSFKCCHLVEYPTKAYDFALIRHFLFDHAEFLRVEALSQSTYEPLANLSKKLKGEIKYHVFHADTLLKQLGNGTEESKSRLQTNLNEAFPLALGIFEEGDQEEALKQSGIFEGEKALKAKWLEQIQPSLEKASLEMPDEKSIEPSLGGRKGYHTEHLKPLMEEMTEVFQIDPEAEW